jgi:hypothetical protein
MRLFSVTNASSVLFLAGLAGPSKLGPNSFTKEADSWSSGSTPQRAIRDKTLN